MARAPKAKPAGIGHNISEEDLAALQAYFIAKTRPALAEIEEAKETLAWAKTGLKKITDKVQVELNLGKAEWLKLLEDLAKGPAVIRAERAKQAQLMARSGVEVGEQQDLLPKDSADDAANAYEDGLRCGELALEPKPPSTMAPIFHQEWQRGYSQGQTNNIMKLKRADAIFAERAAPNFSDDDIDNGASEEPEFDADAEAKKLMASGFKDKVAEEPIH